MVLFLNKVLLASTGNWKVYWLAKRNVGWYGANVMYCVSACSNASMLWMLGIWNSLSSIHFQIILQIGNIRCVLETSILGPIHCLCTTSMSVRAVTNSGRSCIWPGQATGCVVSLPFLPQLLNLTWLMPTSSHFLCTTHVLRMPPVWLSGC